MEKKKENGSGSNEMSLETVGGQNCRLFVSVLFLFFKAYLSNFLDLAATFPDQGATLAGRHHDAKGHGGLAGGCAVCH